MEMAVAISPEDSGFFGPSSSLRRSSSQPRFPIQQGGFRKSASTSRLHDTYMPIYNHHHSQPIHSPHSSPPSTPHTLVAEPTDLSFASTPSSIVSDSDETINIHSLDFSPNIHLTQYIDDASHEDLEPPASPPTGDSYTVSSNEVESSTVASTPESPDVVPKGYDDIDAQPTPSHHVDYLSHNWREEDIWASWKYVISNRSGYTNSERLENASWRTWMKSKNKLKTVSPETLNWLKDCDVTWLYGPLQPGLAASPTTGPPSSSLSQSASFVDKKPILKKRSMSEVMLQQSLSAASLLQQATAAVQAQQSILIRRPFLSRAHTDFPSYLLAPMSRDNSLAPSSDTSGITSPNTERKRIHFNEQVEQCIAVDVKGEDDEYDSVVPAYDEDDSDSDEGIVMKAVSRKTQHPAPRKSALKKSKPVDTKTIASLPSTTLKYRDDSPEPRETAMKHSYKSPVMSPSSSQETLKPSKKSTNFYMDSDSDGEEESDEDEEEDDDEEAPTPRVRSPPPPRPSSKSPAGSASSSLKSQGVCEAPKSPNARSSAQSFAVEPTGESAGTGRPLDDQPSGSGFGLRRSVSTNSFSSEGSGMRRTSSGMFMPIEEGEQSETAGIFGRVIDTVNTARDIVHVIWNVGWRR